MILSLSRVVFKRDTLFTGLVRLCESGDSTLGKAMGSRRSRWQRTTVSVSRGISIRLTCVDGLSSHIVDV